MFIINTTPLGSHKTFDDYAMFLLRRHVISQFYKGSVEVHLIFDNPGRLPNTRKYFEQTRRDKTRKVPIEHCCDDIKGSNTIPQGKWHACVLNCRECKRRLVTYIAKYFLTTVAAYLRPEQTLYLAGYFEEEFVDTHGLHVETTSLNHIPPLNVLQKKQTQEYGFMPQKPSTIEF